MFFTPTKGKLIVTAKKILLLGGFDFFRLILSLAQSHFSDTTQTNTRTKPLRLLLPKIDKLYLWVCFHCRFGTLFQQQILLGIQVVVATCFTLGFYTRFAAILSFYMYTSLILRNTWLYFILDRYFYYLLFYSIFLPLGEYWSLDDTRKRRRARNSSGVATATKKNGVFINPATVALKMLVFWIYLDAGLGKYMDPKQGWTYHADPLPALDTYARHTVFAQHLYGLLGPKGLRLMTPVVVYVEIFSVPVALIGSYLGNPRVVNAAIMVICQMHLGISLSIRNSNLLSYVACCAWLVFLPMGWADGESSSERNGRHSIGGGRNNNVTNNHRVDTPQVQLSMWNKLGGLVTLVMVSAMVGGNIWFETIATGCSTESLRLIWSTLLQNRWNVFIGAEEVSPCFCPRSFLMAYL